MKKEEQNWQNETCESKTDDPMTGQRETQNMNLKNEWKTDRKPLIYGPLDQVHAQSLLF